ncbi:uncharacterized protein F5891DRAFT_1028062, partial [Suillus fuscotomentosus]
RREAEAGYILLKVVRWAEREGLKKKLGHNAKNDSTTGDEAHQKIFNRHVVPCRKRDMQRTCMNMEHNGGEHKNGGAIMKDNEGTRKHVEYITTYKEMIMGDIRFDRSPELSLVEETMTRILWVDKQERLSSGPRLQKWISASESCVVIDKSQVSARYRLTRHSSPELRCVTLRTTGK